VERKWKQRCSQKFRRRAVARMNACENIVRLSPDLRVRRSHGNFRDGNYASRLPEDSVANSALLLIYIRRT
jgi:hypothetical protein